MCEDCGCGDTNLVPVEVHERILSKNDHQARHNREHFVEAGVLAINLMGSPGSGKTALLEATARFAPGRLKLGAVSGDLATDHDAQRLQRAGIPSEAITTGNACHLDAELVHHALNHLPWRDAEVFVIENVGNLVCPAVYDLGQAANVVALAVTEGEDKPLKYPVMFRGADLVVLTKVDLVPHLEVSIAAIKDALARVMPRPALIEVSAKTGEGIAQWVEWLQARRPKKPTSPRTHTHDGHTRNGHAHHGHTPTSDADTHDAHDAHTHDAHTHDAHTHDAHAHEHDVHTHDAHAHVHQHEHELHARDAHTHDEHTHDGHAHDGHAHDGHSRTSDAHAHDAHDGHTHDAHAHEHDVHAHDAHANDAHAHDARSAPGPDRRGQADLTVPGAAPARPAPARRAPGDHHGHRR